MMRRHSHGCGLTLPGIFDRTRFPRAALATAILAATASLGRAGPTGGEVVAGSGSISQPDANTTNVQQNSDKLVVEWQSFDVDTGEAVNFFQPSSDALVLNQILNGDVSVIRGQINANGQVILVNPNGVYFGDSAQLSVGSLVASGHAIDSADFLNGELNFERQEGTAGSVINHGTIEAASGGSVTLLGSRVENHGYIVAHAGRINLAVGDRIALDFDGDGLMRFSIDEALLENLSGADSALTNTGELLANGGTIVLEGQVAQDIFSQVVNNEGIIKAGRIDNSGGVISLVGRGGSDSSVVNSGQIDASALDADSDGGQITLHAEDSTLLVKDGSRISASSNNQLGGQVHLLGEQIALTGDAEVNVSGELGGGEILIGGDYQGKNPDIPNAEKVVVGSGVLLNADANRLGDGGRIIVWADNWTRFAGSLSARGGAEGGDGGFAEVSGKQNLAYSGFADLSAMVGEFGVLLLDPDDISIVAGSGTDDSELTDNGEVLFADSGIADFVIGADTISAQTANVLLQAADEITQDANAAINITHGGTSITLDAGGNITLNGGITTNGGDISLNADANGSDGNGTLMIGGSGLNSQNGAITLTGALVDVDSAIDAGSGAVAMSGATNGIQLGANVTTTGTQTYNHDVTLTGERTLGGGTVSFVGELTGDGSDLEINGNLDLNNATSNIGELDVNGDLDQSSLAVLSNLTRLDVSGSANLGADVSTAGTQTYGGAVTLSDAVTLTAIDSAITFNSTVSGGHHLEVNAGADTVTFGNGGDDDDVNVGSLEVTADSIILNDDITTTTDGTGSQIYNGGVTLNNSALATTNSNIFFNGTLGGAVDLTLTAGTGTVRFGDGTDSDAVNVGSLDVTAGTILFNDNVTTTTGNQIYNGAVELGADSTLDSGGNNVTFNGDLDAGSNSLAVTVGAGDFSYQALNNLNNLTITETNLTLSQDITTTGTQTYDGIVTLEGDRILAGSSVNFVSSVSGNDADGDDSLVITGDLDLDGALTEITTLSVSGTANLAADVTTTGKQTYSGAVTLNGDRTLTAGTDVQFVSTVSGDGGDNDSLDIAGNLDLDGAASGITALDVSGTSNLAADVTTSGVQTYTGKVDLSDARHLTGSLVDFGGDLAGDNNDLDITGNLELNGTTSSLADISVSNNLDLLGEIAGVGSLSVTGTSSLAADVTTDGSQAYTGAVNLIGERTLGASLVTFTTSLAGDGVNNLIINGNLSLGSGGTSNIGLLDVNGNLTSLTGAITNTSSIDVLGTANLAEDIATSGTQNYQGNVTLASGVVLDADDDNISFGGSINGSHNLSVNAGTADVTFAGAVGNTTALDQLIVTGSDIALNGNVTTSGVQTYNGASTITGIRTLDGTAVSFNGTLIGNGNNLNVLHDLTLGGATSNFGDLDVGGNLDLDGAITNTGNLSVTGTSNLAANVTTSGTQTYTGAVDLDGIRTLDGTAIEFGATLTGDGSAFNVDGNLTLADDATGLGAVDIDGNLDAQGEISSVSLDVSGTSTLADNVTTTGFQTYTGDVTLAGDVNLLSNNNNITFSNDLIGAGNSLDVNVGSGDFSYQALGGLNNLAITENDIQLSENISTTGSQTFTGNVTLMNDLTLATSNSDITFDGTLDGNGDGTESLTLNVGGATAAFTGNLGTTNQLEFLDVNGKTELGGDVTTLNQQEYEQAVTLTGDATLSTSNTSHITFGSTIDGASALVLTAGSGNIDFGDDIGGDVALTSLEINADNIDLNHDITTSSGQDYNGAVTLTDDVILNANGNIDFSSTIGGAHDLTIDADSGAVDFAQAIAGLTGLDVSGAGIGLGGDVTTSGDQSYTGAVTLNDSLTLATTDGGNITIDGTVDAAAANVQSLTLNTNAGSTLEEDKSDILITGAVGGINALASLTIESANDSTFNGPISLDQTFTQQAGNGTTTLNDDVTADSFSFTVSSLTLNNVELDTSASNGAITLNVDKLLTIGGSTTIDAGTGKVSLAPSSTSNTVHICRDTSCAGSDASTIYDLGDLSIDAGTIQFGRTEHQAEITLEGINFDYILEVINGGSSNIVITGDLDGSSGGGLIINPGTGIAIFQGGEVHTQFDQTYLSNVELSGDFELTSDAGDINFTGSVTGSDSLTITHANNVNLGGTVNLGGDFDLQDADGTLLLVDGLSLTATNIVLNAATINSGGGATITLSTTANGDIDLITDDLSLGGNLEMNAGTGTITLAPQDSTASLELCSDASCPGSASGGALYNIGAGFSFNSEARFQVGQDNHSGDITLYGFTANYDLALANTGTGSITIEGDYTSNHDLSLTSGSGGITLGATIDTGAGAQTYDGAVTLGDNTNLETDDADVSFTSTIDGAHGLTINTGNGNVNFNDTIGGSVQLASLNVNAGDITFTDISTNGALSLLAQNDLIFGPGTTLTAGDPLTLAINQAGGAAKTLDLNGLTLNSTNIQLLGSGSDRLQGHDGETNDWQISGNNAGTLDNSFVSSAANFSGFSSLVGGTGDDTFTRTGTGQITGQINGAGGTNTYDVSGTTNDVTLVFGQGFSNIQHLIGGAGDKLQGSASGNTDWTLSSASGGTVEASSTATFEGFDYLISGTGGTNIFTSNGQYQGDIELRGNDNRWHYTAGQKLTQGQVLGKGALIIPHRINNNVVSNMSVSSSDLSLPDLLNYTGNLFIGALITPGNLPLNAAYTDLEINANRLTISDAIQTGGNLVLIASEIILTGASISAGDGVSFVAVGDDCAVCGGLSGSGNLIVNAETLVEAEGGQVIAAGGVRQSDNLILDFGGGGFELAVSEEQQLTSQPSSLSDAEGIVLTPNTNAFINRLGLDLVSVAVNFSNPAAAVLGVRAIEVIDLALFEEDLTLFGRLGEGVALAFAQCEEIEGCTPDVSSEELTASIDELQARIDRLESELTTTSDADRREQIQTLLAGFRTQQAEFATYKADLQSFTGFEELMDEELGTDDEIDMEAVERQLAVIETIYTRVRFLENLQFNAERRAHFAETTGLDLTEDRLNEIIESTLAVASRAEAELEVLLD